MIDYILFVNNTLNDVKRFNNYIKKKKYKLSNKIILILMTHRSIYIDI